MFLEYALRAFCKLDAFIAAAPALMVHMTLDGAISPCSDFQSLQSCAALFCLFVGVACQYNALLLAYEYVISKDLWNLRRSSRQVENAQPSLLSKRLSSFDGPAAP